MADMDKFYDNMNKYNFLAPNIPFKGYFWLSPMKDANYIPEHDPLTLNAKIEDGINLYKKFIDEYFFKGIILTKGPIKRDSLKEYHPLIRSTLDKNGHRVLIFDYALVVHNLLEVFLDENFDINKAEKLGNYECLEYVKKRLCDVRKNYWDLKLKGKKSKCYNAVKKLFNFPMCQSTYIQLIDIVSAYITTINNFQKNNTEHPTININMFKYCFDLDKLYLLIGKYLLQYSIGDYEDIKETTPLYSQLLFYISNVLENTDESYNPTIKWFDFGERKTIDYSLDNLKREVFTFESKIHEDKYKGLTYDDLAKHHLLPNILADDFMATINKDDFEALQLSWTFIPSGTIPKEETDDILPESIDKKIIASTDPETTKDKNFKNDALYHKLVLDKTSYKCKIVGKEKFAGYIGYIYDNGLVAFEKLYESNMKHFSQSSNATYIMKFTNFAKFAKFNKQEIIEYIKNTANPEVRRFYHSSSWEQKLLKYLNGEKYNDEINALIDAFIESQQEYKLKLD